ncbi:hypothetical protein CYY_004486 [Polysphondylium violaceum]|uniref:F-box domain-containing protein n=1 Tax=Polysphondylium violaceum TaxID=133409 RepID=A0A8J4PV74_9MYCE|nr:hypothetical protein CYY_004486 [Polysphondylium violaceum]
MNSGSSSKEMDFYNGSPYDGLYKLPYEVILHIFSFMDLTDIKNLKLVCKTFSNVASEYCLWKMFMIKLHTSGKIAPRVCHSAVVYKNKMYVYGGHLPDSHTFIKDVKKDVHSFDFENRKWNKELCVGSDMPEKTEHSAVVYKNGMYVFGGYSGNASYLDINLYKLDLDTLESSVLQGTGSKPQGRSAHSANVWREYMYIFGGWNGTESNNTFYRINLETLEWSQVPAKGTPPPCIRSHSAVIYDDFMYIIGGYGPNGHTEFPYSYDLLNNEWIPMIDNRDGPCSRSRLRTVVYGNSLWCLGGWNRSSYYNDLWKFNLETRRWSKIQSSFELTGIGQYSLVTYKNQIYVYGGYNPGTSSPQPNLYTYMAGPPSLEEDDIMNLDKIYLEDEEMSAFGSSSGSCSMASIASSNSGSSISGLKNKNNRIDSQNELKTKKFKTNNSNNNNNNNGLNSTTNNSTIGILTNYSHQ